MARQTQAGKKQTALEKNPQQESSGKKVVEGKRAAPDKTRAGCTAAERHRMICEEAFFIAEQRGFQGDAVLSDWLRAEAKVDATVALSE